MLKVAGSGGGGGSSLNYQGAWNASTNTPTLVSSVGITNGYYIVSVAGNTNLNGITNWNVGDWAIFNGTAWERIGGGDTETFKNITVTSLTGYMYANGNNLVTASTVIPVANVLGAVANTVSVLAGTGLSGGGNLSSNVTLTNAGVLAFNTRTGNVTLTNSDVTTALGYTPGTGNGTVTSVATGTGLTGGPITTSGTISLSNTAVTAASYGLANSVATFTVNAQGQLTAASNTLIAIANTQISGLGTMSTQNANNVVITGGTTNNLTESNVTIASGNVNAFQITVSNGLYYNKNNVSTNTTVQTGYNAMSVGPISLANGVVVTVSSGSKWVIF